MDFRNVILVMTTNAGAAEMDKPAIGFTQSERSGDDEEAINKLFTPEFRNRLDAVIPFAALPTEVIHQVVRKFVMQLEAQLADRGVTFELTDAATAWLAKKGYDPKMGARPLGRVIQEHIKRPLAEEILFGKLTKGGTVRVDIDLDNMEKLFLSVIEEDEPKADSTKSKKADGKGEAKASSADETKKGSRRTSSKKKASVPSVAKVDKK